MEILCRPATAQDAAHIAEMVRSWVSESGSETGLTVEYVRDYIASERSGILLACVREEPIGLLSFSTRPDLWHAGMCGYIEELYVMAAERGRGAGEALLRTLLARAKAQGWSEVSITVMPDNVAAQKLYARCVLTEMVVGFETHFS
jgi:ribosomal protein S18 acetylase RimI-like enzyme